MGQPPIALADLVPYEGGGYLWHAALREALNLVRIAAALTDAMRGQPAQALQGRAPGCGRPPNPLGRPASHGTVNRVE